MFGRLLLPGEPVLAEVPASAIPAEVSISLIAFLILVIILLPSFTYSLSSIGDSILRTRGNVQLERNLSVARSRDVCAALMLLPVVVALYFSGVPSPSFVGGPALLGFDAGLVVAYILLKSVLRASLRPSNIGKDVWKAAFLAPRTYFVGFGSVVAVTLTVFLFLLNRSGLLMVLAVESALYLVFCIAREAQILGRECSFFTTFLYLCALELVPAAALVAAVVVL